MLSQFVPLVILIGFLGLLVAYSREGLLYVKLTHCLLVQGSLYKMLLEVCVCAVGGVRCKPILVFIFPI